MKQTGKIEHKGIMPSTQKEISAMVAKLYWTRKVLQEVYEDNSFYYLNEELQKRIDHVLSGDNEYEKED